MEDEQSSEQHYVITKKQYQILSSGQYSGTTNITLNAKTDVHSNNCVFDLNTGLMWSRSLSASIGVNSDGRIPFTTTNGKLTESATLTFNGSSFAVGTA